MNSYELPIVLSACASGENERGICSCMQAEEARSAKVAKQEDLREERERERRKAVRRELKH